MIQQKFENITEAQWEAIKVKFDHEAEIQITSDSGSGSTHGVNFTWSIDHTTHELTAAVTSISWKLKALGMTETSVMGRFATWINEATR